MEETKSVPLDPYTVDCAIIQKYMEALSGSTLDALDLEYVLDCDKGDMLREYYNFDPKRVMNLLIYRAVTQGVKPEQLHKDVYCLIYWKNVEPKSEKDRKHFESLVKKYSACDTGNEIYAVTFSRLAYMYPHYYLKLMKDKSLSKNSLEISTVFQCPEFGGLIPRSANIFKEETRKKVITLHLHYLSRASTLPLRTHIVLLRRRMETGLLSDERRIRFFENHQITLQGVLSEDTENALKKVENKFSQKIDWTLLK